MMTSASFIDQLGDIRLDAVFNPYSERCHLYDRADAPRRRRANLKACLDAALTREIDSVWIARDLGYRGGRRTGLPLTDEIHLEDFSQVFGGVSLSRATKGPPVAERTAAIIWQVLNKIEQPVFLWNIFPLHPFEPGEPMSNRCHTHAERLACQDLLFELLEMLRPKRIVAIGRDAQKALSDFDINNHPIRHPSYGGQTEFINGMRALYGL